MKKILLFLVFLLITSCTTSTDSDVDESKTATGEEISFDQGLGKNPTEFVSNWNKLVDEISEDEEKQSSDYIQKITDTHIQSAENILKEKESDLMQV